MKNTIGIIGGGRVGTEAANQIIQRNLGNCLIYDIKRESADGICLDLSHSAALKKSGASIRSVGSTAELNNCDIIVITCGIARKPGMTREDLFSVNSSIISEIASELSVNAPDAIKIVVTNPVDAMTYLVWKRTGMNDSRTIGMSGVLDTSRFRYFLSKELGICVEDVSALVLGSHGADMIPLISCASAGGIPVKDLLTADVLSGLVERTRNSGTELVELLKTGSAYFAAGASIAEMVDAIVNDRKRLLCCSVMTRDVYGLAGAFVGLPVVLGKSGVERFVMPQLDQEENSELLCAASHNLKLQEAIDSMF